MVITLALSYSGRWDINNALKTICAKVKQGELEENDISDELISTYLATRSMPDPDLLIRTGGDFRISNFLLWQGAYAEYCFVDAFWPDWDEDIIAGCIQEYQRRLRKFGGTDT